MVSVLKLHPQSAAAALEPLGAGLEGAERALVARALEFAEPLYAGRTLSIGEPAWAHALGLGASLAAIGMDAPARAAGLLFAVPTCLDEGVSRVGAEFGAEVGALVAGAERLHRLRLATRASAGEQAEVLRKMVLGMVEDIRVVLIRLASRTQTLRWLARNAVAERDAWAREALELYAPLANRLGVWQLKWEMEDLAFRILEPELYRRIAGMLDERRAERERYIAEAVAELQAELAAAGIRAEVAGRPKHIYSIWNKMRAKGLDFGEVYDVRALRVIVPEVKDCYAALGVVHNLWQPIPKEFDDYISRPKGNLYQSLHTAVIGPGAKTLEVQIRTEEMHRHAEFGVAAHWRYKEGAGLRRAGRAESAFDEKIAWLRQLLAWRDEVAAGTSWAEKTRRAALDDTIYVLTPQGKVVDLPAGSTPVDFAYALHTDLGHRCRGARVDGQMVPLNTPLATGQRVEILAAKSGGPSRDWLNPEHGFVRSARARQKLRQWFNAQALAATLAQGRAIVERELRRAGAREASLEELARRLGFAKPEALFAAVAREEVNLRQLQAALRGMRGAESPAQTPGSTAAPARRARPGGPAGVLVVGVDRLMTQLARCCKPLPPDAVRGFVTRGKGVSVHREDCPSLARLAQRAPERLVEVAWGSASGAANYPVDVVLSATDRKGLLRDVGEALARAGIHITAVRTQSRDALAYMRIGFEVADTAQLSRALAALREVRGMIRVARA